MKYRIDKASKTPAYEQLYRLLRADIAEGVLPPRYKLPSKRFLAAELEIAVITEHALNNSCHCRMPFRAPAAATMLHTERKDSPPVRPAQHRHR